MSIIKTHKTKGEIITSPKPEYHRRHYSDILKAEKELFGRRSSGRGDLSTKRKLYLREMPGGKHSHKSTTGS